MRSLVPLLALLLLLGPWAGSAAADFEKGQQAFGRGDLDAACAQWFGSADAGDRRAQYGLGRLLLLKGDMTGLRWVRESAEASYLPAELRMAYFTYGGLYLPVDQAAGKSWLLKAAGHEEGDMRAHPLEGGTARAILAQLEAGAQSNYEQALPYLRKVADAGDAEAQLDYVINLERLIDERSQDAAARRKDPWVAVAHAYAVICESQDAGVGAFVFTPDRIVKRLHDEMSEAQRARSKELVRAWFEAKDAGTLGWLYGQHKRKRSLGEQALAVLETMEGAMGYLRLELMNGLCADPHVPWLCARTPVAPWAPDQERWVERWEVHGCGAPRLKRVVFMRRDDDVSWEFKEWLSIHEEVQAARAEAQALQKLGEHEKARAIWIRLATGGDAASELELGRIYEMGLSVEGDVSEAHKWYVLAGRLGLEDARRLALALRERMTVSELEDSRQRIRAWMDPPEARAPVALFPIRQGGKVGYMDRTGRVVIPPRFDGHVDPSHLADGGGRTLHFYAPVQSALVPVLHNGWWGFLDDRGGVVVPPRFEEIGELHDGRAAVLEAGKWGYLNRKGTLVLGMRFDDATRFREGFALVRMGGKVGVIDTQGTFIVPLGRFDEMRDLREGIVVVCSGEREGHLDVQTGKMIAEPRFDWAGPFEGGLAKVVIDRRRGFIDRGGRVTEVPEVHGLDFTRPLTDTLHVFRRGERFGLFDSKARRVLVEPRYDEVGQMHQGMVLVKSDGKHGYLDSTGAEIIPPRFRRLERFSDGLAAACLDVRACGYIDMSGAWVIPPTFFSAGQFQYGLAVAKRKMNGPYLYIDRTGKTIYSFPAK